MRFDTSYEYFASVPNARIAIAKVAGPPCMCKDIVKCRQPVDVYVIVCGPIRAMYGITITRNNDAVLTDEIIDELNNASGVVINYGHGAMITEVRSGSISVFAQIMGLLTFHDYRMTVALNALMWNVSGAVPPTHCPEAMAQVARSMYPSPHWYLNLNEGLVYPTMMTSVHILPEMDYLKDLNGARYHTWEVSYWCGSYEIKESREICKNICVTARYGDISVNDMWIYDTEPPMRLFTACDELIAEMRRFNWSQDPDVFAADVFALIVLHCDEYVTIRDDTKK